MEDMESEQQDQSRQGDAAGDIQSAQRQRRADRRDGIGLFGGYQGPERRSGQDRRSTS
jgi:hypothetical protein